MATDLHPYSRFNVPHRQSLDHSQFRLVSLLSGGWTDEIICKLYTYHVGKSHRERAPSYQALSYVWGRPSTISPSITVDGYQYKITFNLEYALRCLRDEIKPVLLWVDAICINQKDIGERSSQVSIMREIYQQAEDVIVFFSDEFNHQQSTSPRGQVRQKIFFRWEEPNDELIHEQLFCPRKPARQTSVQPVDVFCLIHVLSRHAGHQQVLGDLSKVPKNHLESVFDGLRHMLTLKWWTRIWVVQEAIVAQKLTVVYGNISAQWELLKSAAEFCMHSYRDILAGSDHVSSDEIKVIGLFSNVLSLEQFRTSWRAEGGDRLLPLLRSFSSRDATDHRDKIYALLGLCNPTTTIRPNYTLSDRDAYITATFQILAMEGSLSAFSGDMGRKNQPDLPSWVPDWSWAFDEYDHRRSQWFNSYTACGPAYGLHLAGGKGYSEILESIKSMDSREMNRVADVLSAETNPVKLFPDWLVLGLEGCALEQPSLKEVCERLKKLCHPQGQQAIWAPRLIVLNKRTFAKTTYDCLEMMGVKVGEVIDVTEPLFFGNDLSVLRETVKGWFAEWAALTQEQGQFQLFQTARHMLVAFASALLSGLKILDENVVLLSEDDEEDLLIWLTRDILQQPNLWIARTSPSASAVDSFTNIMKTSTAKRRMFFLGDSNSHSKSLQLGLGPYSMTTGDEVYILPGGNLPFILRGTKLGAGAHGSPNVFNLVGDCYCHGFMKGEKSLPNEPGLPHRLFGRAFMGLLKEPMPYGMKLQMLESVEGREILRISSEYDKLEPVLEDLKELNAVILEKKVKIDTNTKLGHILSEYGYMIPNHLLFRVSHYMDQHYLDQNDVPMTFQEVGMKPSIGNTVSTFLHDFKTWRKWVQTVNSQIYLI